ncbi:MAG: SAM-dependent methyltransferase, partial [Cryomorphaceae bacterium]|nr:SAM-dependent methyltransferase [Cryomorphaceae bacterium]
MVQDFSKNDPFGNAIIDFEKNRTPKIIRVSSDLCDDDELPIEYLFRTFDGMPAVEKKALELCEGNILDAGAGAGAHLKILREKGFSIFALDV